MKILLESKGPRRLSYDPMEFFAMNKIKNGWTVAIGYLMTPDETKLTFGPRSRKYNIAQNDEKLAEIIEKYNGTDWAEKLKEIRESSKYQAALETGKSAPFDLGDCTIIKIGRYNFNWRDKEANARDWERRDNMELDIRRKYGFGKDDTEYAENDWRRNPKYGGVGIRRVIASGKQGIARYQGDHDTLYTHIDNNGKMAIRQQLAQRNGDQSKWYFVDGTGVMSELPNEVVNFLRFAYKQVKTSDGTVDIDQMEEDERNFKAEIEALQKKNSNEIKTLLMDRILYMVATAVNIHGEHEPVAYVNDKSIYDAYPFLDKDEMMKVIRPWLRLSTSETMQMNERFMTNKKGKKLNESRAFTDLPQDAMKELRHILFTPRYFVHGQEELDINFYPEDSKTHDWLLNVGFDMVLDSENPDTVYVISDENPKPMFTEHFPDFVEALDEFVTEYGYVKTTGGRNNSLVVFTLVSNDGTEASIIQDNIDGYITYYTGFTNFIEIVHMMLNPGKDIYQND